MNEVSNTVSGLVLEAGDFTGLTSTITTNLNVLIPVVLLLWELWLLFL